MLNEFFLLILLCLGVTVTIRNAVIFDCIDSISVQGHKNYSCINPLIE